MTNMLSNAYVSNSLIKHNKQSLKAMSIKMVVL